MSLRQRLALGFFLLSALPLAAFALVSYLGASSALRAAARAEADLAARDLERRVGAAAAEIETRFRSLSRLSAAQWAAADRDELPRVEALAPLETTMAGLGPALAYVEELRFVPLPPPPADAPQAPSPPLAATPAAPPLPPAPTALAPTPLPDEARLRAAGVDTEALRREIAKVRAEVARSLAATASAHREAARAQAAEMHAAAEPRPQRAVSGMSLAGGKVVCELTERGRVVGQLEGRVKATELLRAVLGQTDRERGEIPFALDREARLYVASEADAARIEGLPAVRALRGGDAVADDASADWVVLTREDPASGLRFGIAHPVGAAIAELRAMTARQLGLGAGLIGLTLLAFVPMTGGLVRDVRALQAGAESIAGGDLGARVEVRRGDEIGRLGAAFNRMATELAEHQEKLLAEERRRKEDEIARRLLAAENERRGRELDEAREFQLALLPRELPRLPELDLAVDMTTATEVGGDYYDFQGAADGGLVLAIGDATGHGAAAGTLVTAVKSLFAAAAANEQPAAFLTAANAAIHRMGLVRRAMALTVARIEGRRVRLSAAGMPPLLHYRAAGGRVEELALAGTPLGARAEFPYAEAELEMAPGDVLLFLSDGLPELPDAGGEPFGYERLRARFGELAATRGAACEIVAGLREAVRQWGGGAPPVDDVTLLVLAARSA